MGVVLAAGAGRRMGTPKGLLQSADGTSWAARAAATLSAGGCDPVLVTVGARGDDVARTVPADVVVIAAPDWERGPGAGLAAALRYAMTLPPKGSRLLVLTLVDLLDVDAALVRSVVAAAGTAREQALVRAVDGDRPGHPVALGRDHWERALQVCEAGSGLRALFDAPATRTGVVRVQHAAAVRDADRPQDLPVGPTDPSG